MTKTKLQTTTYDVSTINNKDDENTGGGLRSLFPMYRRKEEILEEILSNPALESVFMAWSDERQEEFLEFCCGNRGVKVLYDTFFKQVFDPDAEGESLKRLLTVLIGHPVKEIGILPVESHMGGDSSLVIMDIVVQTEDGSIIDVEVQKHGYMFPGERAACYSADLLLRQYKRVHQESLQRRNEAKKSGKSPTHFFSYHEVRPVITIVLMESSTKEFHEFPDQYIHTITGKSDTGLQLNLLQQYIFVPLDIFAENMKKNGIRSERDAWAAFLSSDSPEVIHTLVETYPEQFKHLYAKLCRICRDTEGVMEMYSEELAILDRNTVILMQEEMKKDIEKQKVVIKQQDEVIDRQKSEIEQQSKEIEQQSKEIEQQSKLIRELQEKLAQYQQ